MSPLWRRLAAALTPLLALAPCPSSSSPARCASETALPPAAARETVPTHQYGYPWADPLPGTKALVGIREHVPDLARRDCLSNGSNYCFGTESLDFCPDCGNCCVEGKYCCGAGKTCCGSGCCESGQLCFQGKCLAPAVGTVTVTSTITESATRVATQRAVVIVAEVSTSTVVSTVVVTVETAATQTDVVWVTATVVEKRAAPGQHNRNSPRLPPDLLGVRPTDDPKPDATDLSLDPRDAAPIPRQAGQGATSTVTDYATATVDVTSISSVIVTSHTTSTTVTTVYQTNTRVLKAETTITLTSTLTVTSHAPSTVTLTTTANPLPTATTSPSTTPSASASPSSLPTPTIAGIAAGSSAAALLVAGLIILYLRRRSSSSSSSSSTTTLPRYDPGEERYTKRPPRRFLPTPLHLRAGPPLLREPTLPRLLPSLAHFSSTAPAAHHAAEFSPPRSPTGTVVAGMRTAAPAERGVYHHHHPRDYYLHPPRTGGGMDRGGATTTAAHHHHHQHHQQQHHHHQRNSSGFTTLVGTPSPTMGAGGGFPLFGGGKKKKYPCSCGGYPCEEEAGGGEEEVLVVELQGSEVPPASPQEVDGEGVVVVVGRRGEEEGEGEGLSGEEGVKKER